ncbi:MAG: alcohol dehydrogenase catalytic domain-containing protein [Nitrososphaeraceae archaeon]
MLNTVAYFKGAMLSNRIMHAAVFHGPGCIVNNDIYPNCNNNEEGILLKLKACAVCGYDVRVFRNGHFKVTPPIILGHEICGEINRDIFSEVSGREVLIKAGTRVTVSPIVPCLECMYCNRNEYNLCIHLREIGSSINGGFAEYLSIPREVVKIGGIIPVPDNMHDDEAALLEPLACCLSSLNHIGWRAHEEWTIVIIGDGPIGLLHLQLSKRFGARTIMVGKIPRRLSKASSLGADIALMFNRNDTDDNRHSEDTLRDIMSYTEGYGADAIIIATSSPAAYELALRIAAKNSKINIFAGMPRRCSRPLDLNWIHYNQISVTGSFSSTPNMLKKGAELVSTGQIKLSEIISHHYSLGDIKKALLATENYLGLRVIINKF